MKPRALFIGRWQPFHNGHRWLIEQKLGRGIPVLIAVRDVPPDENNPLTTAQTVEILERMYEGRDARVVVLPDIESVNFGRRVGYEINEFEPPAEIGVISATEIRRCLKNKSESWKEKVDEKIHDLVAKYLS
jgi:nicotinamide mononucleotide adenylyltransferase